MVDWLHPPEWMRDAACAGKVGPERDAWHPPETPARVHRALVAEAVAVCVTCPVQVKCGRFGLEVLAASGVAAVYGGMAPGTLKEIARQIGRPDRQVAQHGTRARYVSKTDPCRCKACRAANTRGEHARRAAKRGPRRECQALNVWAQACGQLAKDGSIFCQAHAIADPPASVFG